MKDKYMQCIRGKVQSTDITTNSFKDTVVPLPNVLDIGAGKAIVMAIHKLFVQVAVNDILVGAGGAAFVIAGLGMKEFKANTDFDLSLAQNIWIRELVGEQSGATGASIYEQVTEVNYSPAFLLAAREIHLGVENKQATATPATINMQLWYTLVEVNAREILGAAFSFM